MGAIFRAIDQIPMDRHSPQGRKEALLSIHRHVHAHYNRHGKFNQMHVFPEGTIGHRGHMLKFKSGSFSALSDVQFVDLK
mmetsp:Transcript_77554/g.167740  ORF Transcript_77554/g.167740 Transcript_77554/m.167740 type:complete len:80 (+) Transcript_77554:648-887(+)